MYPKYGSSVDITTLNRDLFPYKNNIVVGTINDNGCDVANVGKIKYGEIHFDGTSTDMTINFNGSYNVKCLSVQLTGAWKSDNSITYVISELAKDHFKVHLTGGNSITLYYLAIGY